MKFNVGNLVYVNSGEIALVMRPPAPGDLLLLHIDGKNLVVHASQCTRIPAKVVRASAIDKWLHDVVGVTAE